MTHVPYVPEPLNLTNPTDHFCLSSVVHSRQLSVPSPGAFEALEVSLLQSMTGKQHASTASAGLACWCVESSNTDTHSSPALVTTQGR